MPGSVIVFGLIKHTAPPRGSRTRKPAKPAKPPRHEPQSIMQKTARTWPAHDSSLVQLVVLPTQRVRTRVPACTCQRTMLGTWQTPYVKCIPFLRHDNPQEACMAHCSHAALAAGQFCVPSCLLYTNASPHLSTNKAVSRQRRGSHPAAASAPGKTAANSPAM